MKLFKIGKSFNVLFFPATHIHIIQQPTRHAAISSPMHSNSLFHLSPECEEVDGWQTAYCVSLRRIAPGLHGAETFAEYHFPHIYFVLFHPLFLDGRIEGYSHLIEANL